MSETQSEAQAENPHAEEYEETRVPRPKKRQTKFRVRRYNPESDFDPIVFAHEDKGVAQRYVKDNHPRGREVYLEHPDGYREHYSTDHEYQGSEPWMEFDEEED